MNDACNGITAWGRFLVALEVHLGALVLLNMVMLLTSSKGAIDREDV